MASEDIIEVVVALSFMVSSVIEVADEEVVSVLEVVSDVTVVSVVELVCDGLASFCTRMRQILEVLEGVAAVPDSTELTMTLLEVDDTG